MIEYNQEQLAVAAAAIFKAQVQQLYDRFEMENLEVNGAEVIFEEDPKKLEDQEEIQIEDLKEAPPKFEDAVPEVTDQIEEVNLGTLEEPRVTYISSLLQDDLKRQIIEVLKEF